MKCCHIPAHQDDHTPYHLLDPIAKLNVDMDAKAKALARQVMETSLSFGTVVNHQCSIICPQWKGKFATQEIKTTLCNMITDEKMIQYWYDKKQVNQHTMPLIDMKTMVDGIGPLSLNMNRFISKWSCDCLATGKNMMHWKMRHKSQCPMCNEDNEDTNHILQCQSDISIKKFDTTVHTLLKKLLCLKTRFYVLAAIRNELYSWRRKQPTPDITYLPMDLQVVILQQRQVGWKQFLEGFIVSGWGQYMQRFYSSQGAKNTGALWAKRLVKYAWEATFEIWEFRNK